ncbi:MAG: hypothetical protein COU25_01745 [Candidatus Levybacteria bacterium CG10_big_fil_rev_8_21_14_0_10_35_13]|nr:MAG: hypothetical protein COU25_01745 [Candidatus Levybacteria bacterium CG10_big_fil_rev_8_21_14_0_10_35_13]
MFYFFLFFLFSLGQIGRISIMEYQINFYLYEILLFVFIAFLFSKFRFKPFLNKKIKWLYYFPLSLILSFLVTFYQYNQIENLTAFLYLIRTSFYLISIIYLYYYANKQKDLEEYIKPGLIFFTLITLLTSFIQYFLYPNLRNLSYLGWDPHLFRIFGVFLDTSIASAIYGLILLFLIINYKKFTFSVFSKIILIISFVTLGLLTYSRGFYLSILTTLFFYFLISKKLKFIVVVLAMFTFALLILPKPFGEGVNLLRTYSIESRAKDYEEGLLIWKKNPVFGIGYNHLKSIRESNLSLPSHSASAYQSSFLTILVTSGVIGLIALAFALKNLWDINPNIKFYLMFLIVFSFMDNILLHPFILFLLLFLVNDS